MSIETKAKNIKAILFDVDGVLTDGGIIYDNNGMEIKRFNVKDGLIISHLKRLGILVGAITGRNSPVVKHRCVELGLDFHYHGAADKLIHYRQIKERYKLQDAEIAYMGDDLIDLPILIRCGLSAVPSDARVYMKRYVDYVADSRGGEGAFRDMADFILLAQGKFEKILEESMQKEK